KDEEKARDAGEDAGENETCNILADPKGRCEIIEQIVRPGVFERGRRHSLLTADEERPKDDRAEKERGEAEAGSADVVEILGDESPQDDIDSRPNEYLKKALRVAQKQEEITQKDGVDSFEVHNHDSSSSERRSRASAMNNSSRSFLPCSRASVFGSPSS